MPITISVHGWHKGANSVAAIKSLQEFADLPLSDAKAIVEAWLDGESRKVVARTPEVANELASALKGSGFDARPESNRTASA